MYTFCMIVPAISMCAWIDDSLIGIIVRILMHSVCVTFNIEFVEAVREMPMNLATAIGGSPMADQ